MEVKREVVILFDEDDQDLCHELKKHLAPLVTQGLITVWDEKQVIGGSNREKVLERHLQSASLVLPLLSAHFMASHEAYHLAELAFAMHKPPASYVVPILLHEVDWKYSIFGQLAPLPANEKPISSWTNRHAAYLDVVKGIRDILATYQQLPEVEPLSMTVTITTPDGDKYTANVPSDVLVDRLLRDFLGQWSSPLIGDNGSIHFSLCTETAPTTSLDRSRTLREAVLVPTPNLLLVSEKLAPGAAISLTVEDDQGEYYITTVLLNTVVSRLAEAFLRTQPETGQAVVEWLLPGIRAKQLRLGESLYSQGVCDDSLLHIYRVVTTGEE
jgi:TIR domain-containing protein